MNKSVRGGLCKARAIRQFKSARPDQFLLFQSNVVIGKDSRLPTASNPRAIAAKRSGDAQIKECEGRPSRSDALKSAGPDQLLHFGFEQLKTPVRKSPASADPFKPPYMISRARKHTHLARLIRFVRSLV
jgi:hypothetical protein